MKSIGHFFLFFFAFGVGIVSMCYLDFEVRDLLFDKGELVKNNSPLPA